MKLLAGGRVSGRRSQQQSVMDRKRQEQIDQMKETIETFARDCQRLPGDAKRFQAYTDLKKKIDDMDEILPLVESLAHESIRDRHWEEIIELSKHQIPYQSETFCLSQLFEADLLKIKEEIRI